MISKNPSGMAQIAFHSGAMQDSAFVVHIYCEWAHVVMNEATVPSTHNALSELLSDPTLVRLVTVLSTTSQSVLEVLEYGFTTSDISRALTKGVIEFNRPLGSGRTSPAIKSGLELGEYYYELVREKIRLTKVGVLMLEIMDSDLKQATETQSDFASPAHEQDSLINSAPLHHIG